MNRNDIAVGMALRVLRFSGITRMTVRRVGKLFILGEDGKWYHPNDLEQLVEGVYKVGDRVVAVNPWPCPKNLKDGELGTVVEVYDDMVQVLQDGDDKSWIGGWCLSMGEVKHHILEPKPEPTPKHSKWETPGVYKINSYRSFRRYKAAGALFSAMDPTTRPNRYLDITRARLRAQNDYPLWAVVGEPAEREVRRDFPIGAKVVRVDVHNGQGAKVGQVARVVGYGNPADLLRVKYDGCLNEDGVGEGWFIMYAKVMA